MKLLVDEALQDEVARRLEAAGHDVAHVRLLGLGGHTDDEVMTLAAQEDRVLVTTDTDFGTILALTVRRVPACCSFEVWVTAWMSGSARSATSFRVSSGNSQRAR